MSDSISFAPPRGMRDFYPEDMAVRAAIFEAWTQAARRFGFDQYDACVVESLELLKRKGGEEIQDQIYWFKDKSDRELALRAEMTPTLARMIVAKQNELTFPLKWFTIAQCFRYERTTRGRKREHYQWNMDVVGEPSVVAEAEVVMAAIQALKLLGLDSQDVRVHVNSRALLSDILARSGIPREHHAATFLALDKRGKIPDEEIAKLLRENGLSDTSIEAAFRVLGLDTLDSVIAALGEHTPALDHFLSFFDIMKLYGVGDMVKFDISVIRGLGYYTGIVFEGFDTGKSLRAIFGGGRYDNLLGDLGGKPMTAVGLGFGDVVIAELLAEKGKAPHWTTGKDLAISYMDNAQRDTAIRIARSLREGGTNVDVSLHAEKPKHFFGRTGKTGFRRGIFIGPDDVLKGVVRLKNLTDRTEEEVSITSLTQRLPAPLKDIKRIVFLGDSITQAGDYVTDIECWLLSQGINIEVINVGLGSETATDLTEAENADHLHNHGFGRPFISERLGRILEATRPDLVFACYGMNDAGSLPQNEEGLKRYAEAIKKLRTTVLKAGAKRIVLCTPPVWDTTANQAQSLTQYTSWLLAQRQNGWDVVDIHGPMRKALDDGRRQDPAFKFADDGVHPGRAGHWLIANAILTQFLNAQLGGISSAEDLFKTNGTEIRSLVNARMRTLFEAWMSKVGHTRPEVPGGPGMPPGISVEEASAKATTLSTQITAKIPAP